MIQNYERKKFFQITTQSHLQQEIVKYLKTTDLLFCASLGGYLDTDQARIMANKEGYQKGQPDIIIYSPSSCGNYSGMALELKTPWGNGELGKHQHDWLDLLEDESGYYCLVSNDFCEVLEAVIKYTHGLL
jgi:hypothetical protein